MFAFKKSKIKLFYLLGFAILAMALIGVAKNPTAKAAGTANLYSAGYTSGVNPYYPVAFSNVGCTWYAWGRTYEVLGKALPVWGNGGQWLENARNSGYATGTTPRANSIGVWAQDGGYGHVAYIEAVDDNSVYYTEGGWNGTPDYYGGCQYCHYTVRPRAYLEVGAYTWPGYPQYVIGYIYLDGNGDTTPGSFSISTSKADYLEGEDTVISWGTSANAVKYGLTIRRTTDNSIVFDDYVTGNSKTIKLPVGNYRFAMAGYNSSGARGPIIGPSYFNVVPNNDSQAPVISNVKITNVSSAGYTITCKITDNVGVTKVQFPTWTDKNDQDDLASDWVNNGAVSGSIRGNTVTFTVKDKDHNLEKGKYNTHIYAYDAKGNYSVYYLTAVTLSNSKAMVKKIHALGHTYVLYNDALTWEQAKAECTKSGGHLVTITSQTEQDVINTLVKNQARGGYYIGASDAVKENTFKWVTGGTVVYNNWSPGEPNDSLNNEDYVAVLTNGKWNDVKNAVLDIGYICEFDRKDVPLLGVTVAGAAVTYDGNKHTTYVKLPSGAIITYSTNNKTYTITKPQYTKAGIYKVYYKVTKTNYETLQGAVYIKILPKSINSMVATLTTTNFTYDGKLKKPTIVLKNGIYIINPINYSISYSNNKNPGIARITITGIGNYTGKITKIFNIKPAVVKPTITSSKKTATIKYNKVTGASGYEIYMATSKNGQYIKISSLDASKLSFKKTGLISNKVYYFKVRTYTISGNSIVFGDYSSVVSIKVK